VYPGSQLGKFGSGRLIVVVVNGYALQIFGFENLVTVQTADIIDPVTPGENFSARMLTDRHIRRRLSLF
jgi:hypothetical protein